MIRLRVAAALIACVGLSAGCNAPRPPPQKLPLELLKIKHPRKPKEARTAASIVGVVLGPDGNPVDFALVAAVNVADDPEDGRRPYITTSLNRGKFELSNLPLGNYGLTVSAPAANGAAPATGASIPSASFAGVVSAQLQEAGPPVLLRLGPPGVVLRGHLTDEKGAPIQGALVRAVRQSPFEGDHFFAKADNDGAFVLPVPQGRYFLVGQAAGRWPARLDVPAEGPPADLRIALRPAPEPPSQEDIDGWIKASGGAIASVDGAAAADLAPLQPIVQGARVVALGEAAYTGSDFAKLKLRALRYLVETMGFSVLLFEAGRADARALDDYVVKGTGELEKIIAGLGYFSLDTTETAALFRWMRSYNEDPRHRPKLRVAGIDVQRTATAATGVEAYLASVDKALLPSVETTLDRLRDDEQSSAYRLRPRDEQDKLIEDIDLIAEKLDRNRRVYIPKGYAAYETARDDAASLAWAARLYRDPSLRGAAMADMAKRTLDAGPRGARAVLWAHNTQISKRKEDGGMGAILSGAYGKDYVAVGLTFYQGWVRAWDYTSGPTLDRGTKLFRLPPPAPDTLEGILGLAGPPLFVADVRKAPPSLAPWLDLPLAMWSVGATFVSDRRARTRTVVKEAFDALVFVKKLTGVTFTKTGERPGRREGE